MARLSMFSAVVAVIVVSAFSGTSSAQIDRPPHQPIGGGDRLITWNDSQSGRFSAGSRSVSWISGTQDGSYIYLDSSAGLVIEDIVSGHTDVFVPSEALPPSFREYWIRPDLQKILFATNDTKQYRYSYFADYHILDVASGELTPLVTDQVGDIQYAELAPVGDAIAFVRGNNLYLKKGDDVTQITTDGGPDMFHGVPDWVYEEEIFGGRSTLWFSPDGEYLAYLSFNETGVETFTIPYYMDGQDVAPLYPRELHLRYPKVGTTNPTVAFTLLDIESEEATPIEMDAFEPDDLIIGEVAWLTSNHTSVAYRAFNRVQDQEKVVRVDVADLSSTVIRDRDGSDGWLDNNQAIVYIGRVNATCDSYYLDLSDESGWNHLYLYPVHGGDAIPLTGGEWEVTSVLHVDTARRLVYYLSTERHSTERHLYSVSYPDGQKKALVDVSVPAYWSASFSAGGSYYILTYQGPNVPYQELYSINSTTTPVRTITDNQALVDKLADYKLPNITYFELDHPDGYSLNVMQRLPANFDPSKKYPVLFVPYGGPGAQEVHKRFQPVNWRTYIASDPELEYITYTVDNRGTGFKGRAFRTLVASQLGQLEPHDQIWAAEHLSARHDFIDREHMGIFGWSYGGFLSAKTVEYDTDGVFSFALIVAPVSDWRFYDSMYTERYMKTPHLNPAGYNATAVSDPEGFRNIRGHAFIAHGLGDDNVHYQHAAALVDLLVGAGVSPAKLNFHAYTDSDHSIVYNGAGTFIYKEMTSLLYREKNRKPEAPSHQWNKRRVKL